MLNKYRSGATGVRSPGRTWSFTFRDAAGETFTRSFFGKDEHDAEVSARAWAKTNAVQKIR